MINQSSLYVLFWIKKSRIKNGKGHIYAKVKVNGARAEFSTFQEVTGFRMGFQGPVRKAKMSWCEGNK